MTGTAQTKPPKNEAEFGRAVVRRLEDVENPTSMRCGEWVLSTGDNGDLIASHAGGGSVLLAKRPEASQEPDERVVNENPIFVAQLVTGQRVVGGSVAPVQWDTVTRSVGDWITEDTGSTAATAEDPAQMWFKTIVIPEDGTYHVRATMPWNRDSEDIRKAMLVHRAAGESNWTVVQADERRAGDGRPYIITHNVGDVYPLRKGDAFRMDMFTAGSSLLNALFGFSINDPRTYGSISLVKVG